MKILLFSAYYERSVVTGANKRFYELARVLGQRPEVRLMLVVSDKGAEEYWEAEKVITVNRVKGVYSRLLAYGKLHYHWYRYKPEVLITDLLPPIFLPGPGRVYQLVHDGRSATPFGRWGMGASIRFMQRFMWRICRNIMTVSEASKAQLVKEFGISAEKVLVSRNGISEKYLTHETDEGVPNKSIDFLYIATFEPRKNHKALIQAFARIRSEQPVRMVLVGRDKGSLGEVMELLEDLSLRPYVEVRDSVGDELELIKIYDQTRVYVSPSYFEGFGMPVLEAMSRGCQLACSNISVFQEICGMRALYFDPSCVSGMADCMRIALSQSNDCSQSADCEAIAARFSWDSIVEQLFKDLRDW